MNKQTMTTMPAGFEPVLLLTAEQAVHTMKEMSMPTPDQVKSVRRPRRSTRKAPERAAPKFWGCCECP